MTIEEKIQKAANSILKPYTLATEAEYKRVRDILRKVLKEQDKATRHACAEAVTNSVEPGERIPASYARQTIMDCRGGVE